MTIGSSIGSLEDRDAELLEDDDFELLEDDGFELLEDDGFELLEDDGFELLENAEETFDGFGSGSFKGASTNSLSL